MHHFTIRDVENLSGIKAHTLRMWEQRYGLCICKRKESQHRYYDNDDLKYILRIAYLYHNGYKISRIAALSPEEITQSASQTFYNDEYEVLVNQLVESGLSYNQEQFEKTLRHAVKTMGLEKSIEKVIYPFLDKIGLLWMTNHVMPAQEHFCSHLIQKSVISAINGLPAVTDHSGKCFLLFTPPGEMHEMPLLLAQYILKKRGLKNMLLGKNCSTEMVQYCCSHQQQITHIFFNFITNLNNADAGVYVAELSALFPNLQIVGAGYAVRNITEPPANVTILHSVKDLIGFQPV